MRRRLSGPDFPPLARLEPLLDGRHEQQVLGHATTSRPWRRARGRRHRRGRHHQAAGSAASTAAIKLPVLLPAAHSGVRSPLARRTSVGRLSYGNWPVVVMPGPAWDGIRTEVVALVLSVPVDVPVGASRAGRRNPEGGAKGGRKAVPPGAVAVPPGAVLADAVARQARSTARRTPSPARIAA